MVFEQSHNSGRADALAVIDLMLTPGRMPPRHPFHDESGAVVQVICVAHSAASVAAVYICRRSIYVGNGPAAAAQSLSRSGGFRRNLFLRLT